MTSAEGLPELGFVGRLSLADAFFGSLLSWELIGRRDQAYRLLPIVKERCGLVILEDLVKFD